MLFVYAICAFSGIAWGQVVIQQDERNVDQLKIQHVLVDATDGYTGETGLSPTCKISIPGATDASACSNSAVELDSTDAPGSYRVTLAASEWETPGIGMMELTGAGSRPSRVQFTIRPSKLFTTQNLILFPNNLSGSGWTLVASTNTQNSTADFNGDTIGDTLTADGTASQHYVHTSNSIKRRGGSGFYVSSVEVKSGTANNAWIGDSAWGCGVDFNTSTQIATPVSNVYLRGWRAENIGSSWFRVSVLCQHPTSDSTYTNFALGIGNGTAGSGPPSFTSSGTMIFARATHSRAEDVPPEQLKMILPSLQSASSGSSVTLASSELASSEFMRNREICFVLTNGTSMGYAQCSCVTAYNGSTKVATIAPNLTTTLTSSYKYRLGGICLTTITAVGSVSGNVAGTVGSVVGAVGSVTANVNAQVVGMNADTVTASAVGANAITSSELAQSAADKVWNTAPEDGSASTALGYLDAIKKYVSNKMTIVGSDYEIFKDDQTTSYATGTTNSAGRDPD